MQHCVSLRCTVQYNLWTYFYCEMITTKILVPSSLTDTKNRKKKKKVFLVMRTLRISSCSNLQINHTAVLTVIIMLHITSLVLICNWKCVPFGHFHLGPPSLITPISGNHKSDFLWVWFLFFFFFLDSSCEIKQYLSSLCAFVLQTCF